MAHDFLIGTYTQTLPHVEGHAEGVLAARFDGTSVADVSVAARVPNPSWVVVTEDGAHVYAVEETGPDGGVSAFARSSDGKLRPLGRVSSGGDSPAHLLVHLSGRLLATGTYVGGTVTVFALRDDGSIGERTAFVQHEGHGPHPRQESPHVHQLVLDPVTGDLVVVDLGLGEVRWYALSEAGALTLRPEATVSVGAAGPRHLAFHPDRRHLFLLNELDSTLALLRREGDRFKRVASLGTRGPEPAESAAANQTAAVRVSADGRTVLVTNRGDDTVGVFAFEAAASALELVRVVEVGGRTPRDLVFAPSGDRVLAACQDSDEVVVFAFDPASRSLKRLGASPVPTPVCLAFV
jgi:6-phosphogluconolactonase